MLPRTLRPIASSTRQFASAAAATGSHSEVRQPEVTKGKVGSTGLRYATHDNYGPASTLSFVVNASSRYEVTHSELGVSHFLRLFGFKGVHGRSHLRLARELDNHGANLTISSDREKIVYTADFLRGDLPLVVELLSGVFSRPEYVLHELNDVHDRVVLDLDQLARNHDEQVMELLHKQAFRSGLGNSNYAPRINLGSIKEKTLMEYTKKHFGTGNIVVTGAGVNGHDLEGLLEKHMEIPDVASTTPAATKYYGGEVHIGRLCNKARVAYAYPTAGHKGKDRHHAAILNKILGGNSHVAWGNFHSLFSKVAKPGVEIEAFNLKYSDAGLVGFYIKAPHTTDINEFKDQAVRQIQDVASHVSNETLDRAKNQLKFDYVNMQEKRANITKFYGKILLSGGEVPLKSDWLTALDAVTSSDIQNYAATLLKSTPTVIHSGNE